MIAKGAKGAKLAKSTAHLETRHHTRELNGIGVPASRPTSKMFTVQLRPRNPSHTWQADPSHR